MASSVDTFLRIKDELGAMLELSLLESYSLILNTSCLYLVVDTQVLESWCEPLLVVTWS